MTYKRNKTLIAALVLGAAMATSAAVGATITKAALIAIVSDSAPATALAIDGTPGHNSTTAASTTVTLSPRSGSVALACIEANWATVSSVTSANLTWTRRAQLGGADNLELWYAVAAADLTNQVITVTLSESQFVSVDAWAVSGADTTNIFDGASSVTGAGMPLSITTTNANDFIFGCARLGGSASGTVGSGWTLLRSPSADWIISEYKIVSATQTALSVAIASGGSNGAIADAIRRGGSGAPPSPPSAATITSVTDDVAPITGALSSGATTDDNNLTVRVSLTGTGAIADNTVRLYNGTGTGSPLGTAHTLTGTNITDAFADVQTGTLSDATYTLTARVTNAGGQSATSTNSFVETVDTGTELAPAFYVATVGGGGSDSNTGTLAAPFMTIARCQTAMRADATKKTCYIRAGTYNYTSGGASVGCGGASAGNTAIVMSTADNGEALRYYPPDGPGTAFITGGGTRNSGICLDGTGITIDGLDVGNFYGRGIVSTNQNNTIINNTVHGTTEVNSNAEIFLDGDVRGNLVTHNYVYNCSNNGIEAHPGSAGQLHNVTFSYNVVLDCTRGCSDCGSLYTQDVFHSTGSTTYITNNYVRDIAANEGSPGSKGIYLDDGSSGHVVTGNVVQPGANGWGCFHVHGGNDNVISGNICDQRTANVPGGKVFYQTSGGGSMAGNTYTNNIALTDTSSAGSGYTLDGSPANLLAVSNNNYYGYGSATPSSTGSAAAGGGDSNTANVNPNFTCGWDYTLPSGSPVFNAPTSFPAQPADWGTAGYWGPPGFTIPRTGTAPSPPHAC